MANTSPTANNAHLEPEDDDWTDNDSGLGGASIASSTTSLASSILQHRKENGRTYHAYKEGKYALPNDKGENDRLDHMYHLVTLTLDNKLCLAPIEKTKVHRVLDVGTGTGIWAIDFADDHPEAEVLGIDLSPIQPLFVPPNVTFQVDDLEEPWTFSHKFDFIHSRMMTGSFSDWPRFLEQGFANLNPGGFIELCDSIQPITADDDSFPPDSAIVKWSTLVCDAMIKFGRPLNSALWHKERLANAGFVDIIQKEYKWPINPWPKDKKAKELGLWTRENYLGGLFGLSVFVFTNLLGWTIEELKILIADVKKEFMDTKIHGYLSLWVVYAQKPAS